MKLTEQEFKELHSEICKKFAGTFSFDIHDQDDISQEIAIIILDGLKRYKKEKSAIKTFIWRHVYNRLVNFKRNNLSRADIPSEDEPEKREAWIKRQEAKKAVKLTAPIVVTYKDDDFEQVDNALLSYDKPEAEISEIINIVQDKLNAQMRRIWISWQADEYINEDDRLEFIEYVRALYLSSKNV
jgi:DNA-directed RNA polymerase specialized sigma24 family protein